VRKTGKGEENLMDPTSRQLKYRYSGLSSCKVEVMESKIKKSSSYLFLWISSATVTNPLRFMSNRKKQKTYIPAQSEEKIASH
jgi:hypothetical protein